MNCQLCAVNGVTTERLVRFPGAAPICPKCDRKACGRCRFILIEGKETSCPSCGQDVRIRKGQP